MINYQRLTEIDKDLKTLNRFKEKITKGKESIDVYGSNHSSYECFIKIEIKNKVFNFSWSDKWEYKILVSAIVERIDSHIISLEEEKESLLNKKWYQFWK